MRLRFRVTPVHAAFALLAIVVLVLPACGRKARPQPLWGRAADSIAISRTR